MRQFLFSRFTGPLVALGLLVALVCLAGSWYINRLQADLARAIREDAAGMQAAVSLQVQLRNLRVHSLVLVADRTDMRWEVVQEDLARVNHALEAVRRTATARQDAELADRIERDYAKYYEMLGLQRLPSSAGPMSDLARWSDSHHMAELLVPCRALAALQDERMQDSLSRSEVQTAWAGRVLLALGLAGILAGLLSGYATARALGRRVAQLCIRVQAVQARLDQDVGAMTVQGPPHVGDLDEQLDRIVDRVSTVCQRLQEQERSLLRAEQLAAVGQLAASVAHEVRNPLTGVKLLLQAAARQHAPIALDANRLNLLLQEVARIERTVQGLMDFAHSPPTDFCVCDLRRVIAAAVDVAQARGETKAVAIHYAAGAGPLWASVDKDRMISLLTNLLFNAIDEVPNGGEVNVSALSADGMIEVAVADNGPGIDPAVASRLFAPFVTTKASGTGLGLTIAHRVAREHGGTLTAADRPGGGTCFTLRLPATERVHDEAAGH